MLSYRKLAMRVLGRPLHTGGSDSPRPASQRAAAFILTAAMLTALTAPAFAETWYIEDGDITISAGKDGNDVTQKGETTYGDKDTVITNHDKDKASSNTVTIEAENKGDKVEVTLKDVNIDASSGSEAAVSVTGKGDTNIELDGDNELKSSAGHAGLEHNKTDTSGELTIQDKDKNGSLEAVGGFKGAGIGSAGSNDAQVKITGGNITATSDDWGAGIGSGALIGPDEGDREADAIISIEGKVTIKSTAGKDNAAIGANGEEQVIEGLLPGSSIDRRDADGNDISLPGDKQQPADSSEQNSDALEGLTVTDAAGKTLPYTVEWQGSTVVVTAKYPFASLQMTHETLLQLQKQGAQTLRFCTESRTASASVAELLNVSMAGAKIVWSHDGAASALQVNGADHNELLK